MKIDFTSAYDEAIENKIKVYRVLKQIGKIDFSYTVFNEVLIFFQCFPKDIKSRKVEEFKTLRRKTKTLELYLILDYERMVQGTDPENLQHIKEVFLNGCETFLKPLKDFKWQEFSEEIQKTLIVNR